LIVNWNPISANSLFHAWPTCSRTWQRNNTEQSSCIQRSARDWCFWGVCLQF